MLRFKIGTLRHYAWIGPGNFSVPRARDDLRDCWAPQRARCSRDTARTHRISYLPSAAAAFLVGELYLNGAAHFRNTCTISIGTTWGSVAPKRTGPGFNVQFSVWSFSVVNEMCRKSLAATWMKAGCECQPEVACGRVCWRGRFIAWLVPFAKPAKLIHAKMQAILRNAHSTHKPCITCAISYLCTWFEVSNVSW